MTREQSHKNKLDHYCYLLKEHADTYSDRNACRVMIRLSLDALSKMSDEEKNDEAFDQFESTYPESYEYHLQAEYLLENWFQNVAERFYDALSSSYLRDKYGIETISINPPIRYPHNFDRHTRHIVVITFKNKIKDSFYPLLQKTAKKLNIYIDVVREDATIFVAIEG